MEIISTTRQTGYFIWFWNDRHLKERVNNHPFDRRRFKFQRDFCIERDVEFVSTVSEQIKKRLELSTESWFINTKSPQGED